MHRATLFFALSLLIPLPVHGDYGWIPDYQKLNLKGGLEFYKSSDNFDSTGDVVPLSFNNTLVNYGETVFFLEPEFGIAQDWSAALNLNFLRNSVTEESTGNTALSGAGLGDIRASIKYILKNSTPIITLETYAKIPTSGSSPSATDELVTGDGNFDLGLILHTGHRIGNFGFALSPGIVGRFGGYSSAATLDAALELDFQRGYVRAFMTGILSFVETRLFESKIDTHDAFGTGGSYARLAGSPTGFAAGGKIGVKFLENWRLEGAITHAVAGYRYPDFLKISISLVSVIDFFKPDPRKKVREVPLDDKSY